MNRDDIADLCAAQPGAWPDSPWGPDDLVYKIGPRKSDGKGGKIFCFLGGGSTDGNPQAISLKADPAIVPALHQTYEAVSSPRYLDKAHWIQIQLGADVPPDELEELVLDSYQRVLGTLSKRQQRAIAAGEDL